MKRYFLLILLLVTLLCGCNITSLDNSTNKPNFNDGNSNNQQEGNNNETNKYNLTTPNFTTRKISSIDEITLDDFFNLGNRVDISVMIKEAELKKLQADYETGYKSEIYRFADKVEITLTNYGIEYKWEYANVGIRQKGNTSRNNIISIFYEKCFDMIVECYKCFSFVFFEFIQTNNYFM